MGMSGVMGSLGPYERDGEAQCAFVHESDDMEGIVLDVVVIHRLAEPLPRPGLRAGLWEILSELWDWLTGQPSPPTPLPEYEPGWGDASGVGGPFEVRFNAERRLVRAARREIALPSRGTLIVLIDMRDASDEHPEVITAVVDIPVRTRATSSQFKESRSDRRRERAEMNATIRAWNTAISDDPTVRAFRARTNGDFSET